MTDKENPKSYFPNLTPEESENLFSQIDSLRNTISSAFNISKIEFPDITTGDNLDQVPPYIVNQVINSYVTEGILFLSKESENKHVRITSYRLFSMWDKFELELQYTHNLSSFIEGALTTVSPDIINSQWIDEAPYATIYSPEHNNRYGEVIDSPILLVPNGWIELANEQPVLALSYLLRSATYARDDYYGKLQGADDSKVRADNLVSNVLVQAYNYDQNKLGIALDLDDYHYNKLLIPFIGFPKGDISEQYFYDDPPQSAWHYYPEQDEPPPYGNLP